jgi:predicted amidohydrolase
MRIGFLQMQPKFGAVDANVATIETALQRTRDAVVVLPELCTTGYVFASRREAEELAEPSDGPSLRRLAELARRNRLTLCLGFAESDGRRVYNSAALLHADGSIDVYRKAHLFDREKLVFDAARPRFAVTDGAARFGMLICFDWIFPEACRSLALAGAQIVLHPSNLVLPWCQDAMRTRCIENRIFAVTCNRTGTEARAGTRLRFTGRSQVVDPRGQVLVRAGENDTGLQLVRIDPRVADDKRITSRNDLFEDRRPELYKALTARRLEA